MQQVQLKDLSLIELKALVYDGSVVLQNTQRNLEALNAEIQRRAQLPTPNSDVVVDSGSAESSKVEPAK